MTEPKNPLHEMIQSLETLRDELALQIHLGSKEAREEWKRVEHKLADLKQRARPYGDVVGETAGQVGTALELAAKEVQSGYKKIRELLKS